MQLKSQKYLYWVLQVSGWGMVGLTMLFYARNYQVPITSDILFGRIAVVFFTGILVSHLLRMVIKKWRWMQQDVDKVIPKLIVGFIASSLLYSFIVLNAYEYLSITTGKAKQLSFGSKLAGYTVDNSMFFLPWVLIYYFYHFFQKSQKQQMDGLTLESLVKELELKTIKAHINPHFIFNALNSIRALVDENPIRARAAITELSNILRSSMHVEKQETVALENELAIVKDYLALENMRFEDRLKIEYDIDAATLTRQVPPMMLQTLVENAIKHGIGKLVNGGVVKVISDVKNDYHELIVQNTGQLNGYKNKEQGFGISSTTNRLNILFGDKAKFDIKQLNSSMVEAKVLIPLNEY